LQPLSPGRNCRFQFATYDIESKPGTWTELEMLGFYDGVSYSCFRNVADFLDHVLKPRYHGYRFFAHFGGRYDVHFIFDWLRKQEPTTRVEVYCAGSCVISMKVIIGRHYWKFVDSYRLLPKSLKTLTDDFDVLHKKLPFDQTSIEYNRHDCIGLYEVLDSFFDTFNLCSETIASHAMRVFRTKYLKKSIAQPPLEVENFVRRSYTGGRCEVYRFDKTKLNHYDVNSLYPAAMLENVPIEFLFWTKRLPKKTSEIGFYSAEINYPDSYIPILPWKSDKLYFPVGRFSGVFTSLELEKAINAGAEVKIDRGVLFHAEPVMQEYATDIYGIKIKAEQEGKRGLRYIAKILANSLYGKTAQGREHQVYLLDNGQAGVYPLPNGLCYRFDPSRACFILPHIASTITARARLALHGLMKDCKNWYSDTDCLFCKETLPTGDKIGNLKFEGSGSFEAYGLKEYQFNSKYRVKGVSRKKNAQGEEDENAFLERIRNYLDGKPIVYDRIAGFVESIRAGKQCARIVQQKKKRAMNAREKRCRIGFDTRPWNAIELT
jgi:hypothetical protein